VVLLDRAITLCGNSLNVTDVLPTAVLDESKAQALCQMPTPQRAEKPIAGEAFNARPSARMWLNCADGETKLPSPHDQKRA
jgi:hypothetical protein